jgi:AcrR family transcriptional regulator
VGRPAKALISRESAARAALAVIDAQGLDGLSLELVARELGVKAPSLYYHFQHKAELLAEVARLLLLDIDATDTAAPWRDYIVALCVNTRRSVLAHPKAAQLLLQFFPRHLLLAAYDHWISTFTMPVEEHLALIEVLEKFTFGSALFEAAAKARGVDPMPQLDPQKLPHLARAIAANRLDEEGLFVDALNKLLNGFHPEVGAAVPAAKKTTPPARKATKKTIPRKTTGS